MYSVSRFIWKDEQRKQTRQKASELQINDFVKDYVKDEQNYLKAETAFSKLGERCKQLLTLFYHQKQTFKRIAEMMQFSSDRVAKNQKYKCLSKARTLYQSIQS